MNATALRPSYTREVRTISNVTVTEPETSDYRNDPFVLEIEKAADLVRPYGPVRMRYLGSGTFALCAHGPLGAVRALVTAHDPDIYEVEPGAVHCTCPAA